MPAVTGVVLAAGASERMGKPKLLLPYRGTTVLKATIAAVGASAVGKVIVVTGARAEDVEASLGILISPSPSGGGTAGGGGGGQGSRQSPVASPQPEGLPRSLEEREDRVHRTIVVRNPDYRRGNMSSLLTATSSDPETEAFILVPGDMPTIRSGVVDSMIDLWAEERPWAAVTEYSDRIAHPFLLSRDAVEAIAETAGEKVLGRLLVDSDDDRVMRLSIPYEAPRDINTPDDYEALLRGAR
jgi:molybdenum cofactor cytidylyltransferase